MVQVRTLTSSEVKESLGEVLATLTSDRPVQITRNGRLVAIICAPTEQPPVADTHKLAKLVALYAASKVSWRHIGDEMDVSFGEVLLELAKQNLQLPRVTPSKRPEQAALFDAIFHRPGQ